MKKIVCGVFALVAVFASAHSESAGIVLPETSNRTGKVLIQTVSASRTYPFTSYIITSRDGVSMVVDPTAMPRKEVVDIRPSLIVSTHGHGDHTDALFASSYDCEKILYTKADVTVKGFRVYTIPSSHSGDSIAASGNVIAVFEVDGLRIAHMGDIGQTALTGDQLKALGHIDIAFMQFENSYSSMSLSNEKGFNLIKQVKPSIIIPTHYTPGALPALEAKFGKITEVTNSFAVSKADVSGKSMAVYRILNTHRYW